MTVAIRRGQTRVRILIEMNGGEIIYEVPDALITSATISVENDIDEDAGISGPASIRGSIDFVASYGAWTANWRDVATGKLMAPKLLASGEAKE